MANQINSRPGLKYAGIPLLFLALVIGVAPLWSTRQAAATAPIPGNRLTLPPGARVLGPLATGHPLRLIVGLSPRHPELLEAFAGARAAARPAPHPLTPAQSAALFSPTISDERTVIAYLRAHGLRIVRTYPDRLLLDVAGTAAQAEAAFGVSLVRYRDGRGHVYYANATAPRLPARLAGLVSAVVGLRNDVVQRHAPLPRLHRPSGSRPAHENRSAHGYRPRALASPPADLLTPAQIIAAYDFTPVYSQTLSATGGLSVTAAITGAGQTVAVYELSPYDPADIASYDAAFGLAAPAPVNIPVDGGATNAFGDQGTVESAMDIELVRAVAPGAQILVYSGPASPNGSDNTAADDTYAQIVNDGRAQVLATSWGQCEPDQLADSPPDMTLLHNLFARAVAQGMTIVAASGDTGANDCTDDRPNPSVDYPASDPLVIGVGGTSLDVDNTGRVVSETAWSGSGGGASAYYSRPSWQLGLCPAGTGRLVPDVALNAERGYAVWASGGWKPVNGTSAGPPVWAGLLALANQARGVVSALQGTPTPAAGTPAPGMGDIHPQLYALGPTAAFRDIVTGAGNGAATPGPGWDAVTGWGVPDAYALLRALATQQIPPAPSPAPCPTSTAPVPTGTATPSPMPSPTATATRTATPLPSPPQPSPSPTRASPSPTRLPVDPTPGTSKPAVKKSSLIVRVVPGSVYAGGQVMLQLRGAPGARRTVVFELHYPGRKPQRVKRTTDAHGAAALRLRVLNVAAQGHGLVVRLSATVHDGRRNLVRWTSFRVLPTPMKHHTGRHSSGAGPTPGPSSGVGEVGSHPPRFAARPIG